MNKDLEHNTEFRIKWPRGMLGALPADQEQFMMIEDLYKTTEKIEKHIDSMSLNKVNIEFLRKQVDKVLEDIENMDSVLLIDSNITYDQPILSHKLRKSFSLTIFKKIWQTFTNPTRTNSIAFVPIRNISTIITLFSENF